MNRYRITLILTLVASIGMAQINKARMKQDLEVAGTVLNSLLNKDGVMYWNGVNGNTEGKYIEGYGVILSMPNNHLVFGNIPVPPPPGSSEDFNIVFNTEEFNEEVAEDVAELQKEGEEYAERREVIIEQRVEERAERAHELAEREREIAVKAQKLANRTIKYFKLDSLKHENDEKRLEKMKIFLIDYAHLISQLEHTEKILITDKSNQMFGFSEFHSVESMKRARLSAEISMKDAKAYQAGKITREEALSRVVVNKNDTPKEVYKDLELYKTMLSRLYSSDLSETYYANGGIGYEKIKDLGVIYYIRTVSSVKENGKWRLPTQNKDGLSQEERDELVKSLYPKFEQQLKENMVEYGRTITSLNDEERLIFNVRITKCEGCDIPETLEISVESKELKAYNQGKLTKDEVMKKIKVSQGEKQ